MAAGSAGCSGAQLHRARAPPPNPTPPRACVHPPVTSCPRRVRDSRACTLEGPPSCPSAARLAASSRRARVSGSSIAYLGEAGARGGTRGGGWADGVGWGHAPGGGGGTPPRGGGGRCSVPGEGAAHHVWHLHSTPHGLCGGWWVRLPGARVSGSSTRMTTPPRPAPPTSPSRPWCCRARGRSSTCSRMGPAGAAGRCRRGSVGGGLASGLGEGGTAAAREGPQDARAASRVGGGGGGGRGGRSPRGPAGCARSKAAQVARAASRVGGGGRGGQAQPGRWRRQGRAGPGGGGGRGRRQGRAGPAGCRVVEWRGRGAGRAGAGRGTHVWKLIEVELLGGLQRNLGRLLHGGGLRPHPGVLACRQDHVLPAHRALPRGRSRLQVLKVGLKGHGRGGARLPPQHGRRSRWALLRWCQHGLGAGGALLLLLLLQLLLALLLLLRDPDADLGGVVLVHSMLLRGQLHHRAVSGRGLLPRLQRREAPGAALVHRHERRCRCRAALLLLGRRRLHGCRLCGRRRGRLRALQDSPQGARSGGGQAMAAACQTAVALPAWTAQLLHPVPASPWLPGASRPLLAHHGVPDVQRGACTAAACARGDAPGRGCWRSARHRRRAQRLPPAAASGAQ